MALAITFIFFIIAARYFYVQVIWGGKLVLRAADQWNRDIPVIASRGRILDRNGVQLVGNAATYSVFVRPRSVSDKNYAAAVLAGVLDADEGEILKKISASDRSEVTVARQVERDRITELAGYALDGVYFAEDNTRVYAYGDALCQVLGFTSSDGMGISGIEKMYDGVLGGQNGSILYTTDIVGNQTEDTRIVYNAARDGSDISLTVDIAIQLAAEQAMKDVCVSSQAKRAACVVLDPNTFEVLAMVNYPSYDLNDVPRDDPATLNSLSRNTLVCDIYEPGSTFKVLTAAANIQEYLNGNGAAFSPTYIFNGSRTRSVDGTTVRCWSDHANGKHSNQTLADALNNSCNPCFTDIALALGTQTFYDYLSAFGLGNVTGIDFAGEALGMLVPQSLVRDCDLARIGFGQTVAVTALQLACAVAAAVNGGNYYVPSLLKGVVAEDGVKEVTPVLKNRAISGEASAMLRQMLEGVVREGSGKNAYIEGYRVGGKTGTAQKYENGGVASGKYVSSFVGFFPADAPRYLALVIVDEPQGAYYGSVVAAPAAKALFEDIIAVKNILPYE